MSARKPLALVVLICGLTGTTVHADPISWPSGLNNWLIYLAAPSGSAGTGPVNYTVPSVPAMPSLPAPVALDSAPPAAAAPPTPVAQAPRRRCQLRFKLPQSRFRPTRLPRLRPLLSCKLPPTHLPHLRNPSPRKLPPTPRPHLHRPSSRRLPQPTLQPRLFSPQWSSRSRTSHRHLRSRPTFSPRFIPRPM